MIVSNSFKSYENHELPQNGTVVLPKRIGLLIMIFLEKDPRDLS